MAQPPATGYSDSLSFLLSQTGARSAQLFAEQLRPLGVTPRAFGVLSNLALAEGQTQQQLADALGIHRNNMVALIDEMETSGWVRRHRSDTDRRAFELRLTPAGHALLARVDETDPELEEILSDGLSAEERETLLVLLKRTAALLGLHPGVHPHLGGRR